MYYFTLIKADWCGHCQEFIKNSLKTIKDYIKQHQKFIEYTELDADNDSQIIDKLNVIGFPTLRIYEGRYDYPFNKQLLEFSNRDPDHIIRVLLGFEKKITGEYAQKKQENFNPTKSVSYRSYYHNYNGKVNREQVGVVCENGVCKQKDRLIDENGRVKETNKVLPYNDVFNELNNYYDASLELRTFF